MNAKLEAGLSPGTVKHHRDTLRNALNVAMKWNLVVRNAAALVNPPRREKQPMRGFTAEEAHQFLDTIRGHRLESLFSVTLSLGLRQGEILELQWSDVDLENGVLNVRQQLQRIDGTIRLVELKTEKSRRTINLPGLLFRLSVRTSPGRPKRSSLPAPDGWKWEWFSRRGLEPCWTGGTFCGPFTESSRTPAFGSFDFTISGTRPLRFCSCKESTRGPSWNCWDIPISPPP